MKSSKSEVSYKFAKDWTNDFMISAHKSKIYALKQDEYDAEIQTLPEKKHIIAYIPYHSWLIKAHPKAVPFTTEHDVGSLHKDQGDKEIFYSLHAVAGYVGDLV